VEPLDRLYRPKAFPDVIGQDGIVKVLKKNLARLDTEGIDPSIFFGPWGSGKTTLARIYARAILCENRQDFSPCNVCESCKAHLSDTHPAYTEIDGANITKVEDFRKILESTNYQVASSKYRVFLIDECHMMSKASQNLFLKPLEDGIPGVFWLFCTTEYHKIIETIRSRCVDYGIRSSSQTAIANRVVQICEMEGIPCEREAAEAIVAAKGHFRDVLKFVNQVRNIGGVTASVVFEYLDVGVNDGYFDVLSNIIVDTPRAMSRLEMILERVNPSDAYNGLAQAAMDAYKAAKGIRCSMVVQEPDVRKRAYDAHGDNITRVTSYLLDKGGRRVDHTHLISTVLLLEKHLTTVPGGGGQVVVREVIREVPVAAPAASTAAPPTTPAPSTPAPTPQPVAAAPQPAPAAPKTNGHANGSMPVLISPEMDAKARKKKTEEAQEPVPPPVKGESRLLTDVEFSLLLQKGQAHG
jgi:DNA polymerase-3 subunit gamma/tau